MKRASDATIQRRTATAQRKNIYWANIILALIPVVNGFYYLGAGGVSDFVAGSFASFVSWHGISLSKFKAKNALRAWVQQVV